PSLPAALAALLAPLLPLLAPLELALPAHLPELLPHLFALLGRHLLPAAHVLEYLLALGWIGPHHPLELLAKLGPLFGRQLAEPLFGGRLIGLRADRKSAEQRAGEEQRARHGRASSVCSTSTTSRSSSACWFCTTVMSSNRSSRCATIKSSCCGRDGIA